jgi:protein gp37
MGRGRGMMGHVWLRNNETGDPNRGLWRCDMPLNLSKGNMYPWITHTWNPIRGECPFRCSYCYVPSVAKRYGRKIEPLGLVERELRTNLHKYRDLQPPFFIFVGSTVDMFAPDVPSEWIHRVLEYCKKSQDNRYLFQTKNPKRFHEFNREFPANSVFGTTIESTHLSPSTAPKPSERAGDMMNICGKKMVSIEPILDFDLKVLVDWIREIEPEFVSVGADSKGHNLPEPSSERVSKLINALGALARVRIKSNIRRLIRGS